MSILTEKEQAKGSCLLEADQAQQFDANEYPGNTFAASLPLVDFRDTQSLLFRESNFSAETIYDVFQVKRCGSGQWRHITEVERFQEALPFDSGDVATRIIFLGLVPTPDTSFGCRMSVNQHDVKRLLETWEISPLFVNMMLGQYTGNHLPATEICSFDGNGNVDKLSFVLQQPRWGYKGRRFPISMFSNYHIQPQRTDCVITFEIGDPRIEAVQRRLTDVFNTTPPVTSAATNISDPFFMHTLIAHQSFMDSDSCIFRLGQLLYKTLDQLNEYASEGFDREKLESTTFELHDISQDMDSLLTSADTNIALVRTLQDTQRFLLKKWPQHSYFLQPSLSTSAYLNRAFEARKRWLLGARARKETAMNLVYHLVTQKDTELSTAIARDTKDDSASMKSIAALTMVFLPASAVSSFFGMAFFGNANNVKSVSAAPEVWLFFAITLPLTLLVMAAWKWWPNIVQSPRVTRALLNRRERKVPDEEHQGSV